MKRKILGILGILLVAFTVIPMTFALSSVTDAKPFKTITKVKPAEAVDIKSNEKDLVNNVRNIEVKNIEIDKMSGVKNLNEMNQFTSFGQLIGDFASTGEDNLIICDGDIPHGYTIDYCGLGEAYIEHHDLLEIHRFTFDVYRKEHGKVVLTDIIFSGTFYPYVHIWTGWYDGRFAFGTYDDQGGWSGFNVFGSTDPQEEVMGEILLLP